MGVASQRGSARLVPITGPALPPVELAPKPGGLLAGRQDGCDLRLAAESVSRAHARFVFDSVRWHVIDLKSRWGTFVNGLRVSPDREVALSDGDLVRISPWTFRFGSGEMPSASVALEALADPAHDSIIQTLSGERMPSLGVDVLGLLLESAAGIHAAVDERSLAELVIDKACQGTGMPNTAVLRPLDDAGRYEVIASRWVGGDGNLAPSRSLLAAAAGGEVAELSSANPANVSHSIISMGVRSALCVPILLGQTVAAFLYLDARGDPLRPRPLPLLPSASAFCLALARMAGLALANLKRIEMERRSAQIEADLVAAAAAQQWMLPRRQGGFGAMRYTGESRPGRHVGGDFYDVIPLAGGRLAVAIGDVSGKGVAASVLMTASQGFLHAALQESGDPAQAVNRLNRFVHARTPGERFVTLWVGVLDAGGGVLRYVDAGHGYALLGDDVTRMSVVERGGQIPVGVEADTLYTEIAMPLPPTGCALLLSDGLIEQFGGEESSRHRSFGVAGANEVLRQMPAGADAIAALFNAVTHHAGRTSLSDDSTAVMVTWEDAEP